MSQIYDLYSRGIKKKLENYGLALGQSVRKRSALLLRPVKMSQIFTGRDNIGPSGPMEDGRTYSVRSRPPRFERESFPVVQVPDDA